MHICMAYDELDFLLQTVKETKYKTFPQCLDHMTLEQHYHSIPFNETHIHKKLTRFGNNKSEQHSLCTSRSPQKHTEGLQSTFPRSRLNKIITLVHTELYTKTVSIFS